MKCVSNIIRTNTTIFTDNSIAYATIVANVNQYNSIKNPNSYIYKGYNSKMNSSYTKTLAELI